MRITGGKYRSRVVKCPPGVIRPAMDRMRESMFSILGDLRDLSFLDVFSGSGVIGLEAASRGSTDIQLVELDSGKKKVHPDRHRVRHVVHIAKHRSAES